MPKFQVTVADEAGHKLYDETIEAEGPREACRIAARESATLDAPDHLGGPGRGARDHDGRASPSTARAERRRRGLFPLGRPRRAPRPAGMTQG